MFLVNRSKKARSEENFAGDVSDLDGKKHTTPGFVIQDNGKPISPEGGLHVHTPSSDQTGKRFFAVVCKNDGKTIGFAATDAPIDVVAAPIQPIRLNTTDWKRDSCKGLPLVVMLHGRGGGVGVNSNGNPVGTHLLFGDKSVAWREGIPFKFSLFRRNNDYVEMKLNDRVWIGRIMGNDERTDARDQVPAISTFWYGYNPNIATSIKGPNFVCDNYTERLILALVHWAQDYLGTDKNRTYLTGGSMGGTGSVQLATHFPNEFAAVAAHVPIYSYTFKRAKVNNFTSVARIICTTGRFTEKDTPTLPDGTPLLDALNGARNIAHPEIDFPPILATNGRMDASMPWENNPPFFKAAQEARQSLSVCWNNGDHGSCGKMLPPDMKCIVDNSLLRYRLDMCFPAFTNSSTDRNYGNGDPADGDIDGWLSRGYSWTVIQDTPTCLELDISTSFQGISYPVTTDITFRRRQQFKPNRGETIVAKIGDETRQIALDDFGLLTLNQVKFLNGAPLKIVFKR
ncbi:MAG: prolyl oligopeptidase family serine peptidase, partial [Victivallales bacterium]|nr:prolyl oligopeptidase family serine peptidase [Victivallales bacterium]